MTLKSIDSGSLKVTGNGTVLMLGYGFLFVFLMTLSCIISEIKRYISRKSRFSYPLAFDARVKGGSPSEYYHTVWCTKTRMVWLNDGEKTKDMFKRLDRMLTCDRRTDNHTSCHSIVRATHTQKNEIGI